MVIQPATYAPLPQRASTTSAAQQAPQQPADKVDLSGLTGLPKLLVKTGEVMAKAGGWGGAALGGGLGLLVQGGLQGGFLLPALSAFLIGTDCAKSRQGQHNLDKGAQGLIEAASLGQAVTPARGAASAVTIVASCAALGVGMGVAGLPGLILAVPAMLGTAYFAGKAAGQAEQYALNQAYDKLAQP